MTVERAALAYHEVLRIQIGDPGNDARRRWPARLANRFVTWRLRAAFAPVIRRAPFTVRYRIEGTSLTVESPLVPPKTIAPAEFVRAVRGPGVICLFTKRTLVRRALYFQTPEQEAELGAWLASGGLSLERR